MAEGLLYAHSKLSSSSKSSSSKKMLEATAFLYALIEMLEEKGLISVDELDQRIDGVADRLSRKFRESGGVGVLFQDPEFDKYRFEGGADVDCETRIHLCKATCCHLPFALSKQDVREGVVRWDLEQPYLIDHGEDGCCSHLDHYSASCTIYEQRPVPCRGFDCSTDQRIWLDFENMRVNPDIERADWPRCLAAERGWAGDS